MNIQKKQRATFFISALGMSLLAGCMNWNSKESSNESNAAASASLDSKDVLLTINGKPALTVQDYEEQLDMARQGNPQIDMVLQMMPNAEKDYIFKGIATQELIKAWGESKGLDKDPKFQQERNQLHKAMDLQLYMKHFDDAHPVQISESDMKKFYEEKKDTIPGLMISPGGIQVKYVRLESKEKAKDFLEEVKEKSTLAEFTKEAEKEKLTIKDEVINDKSQFGDAVKNTILGIKKFPSVHMVKVGDNGYWVLLATSKSDAQYRDFKSPEVQQGLKKMMTDERKEKQLESLIDNLKKEMKVVENYQYFDDKESAKKAAMQASMPQHEEVDMHVEQDNNLSQKTVKA